jgi:hypothetical protein
LRCRDSARPPQSQSRPDHARRPARGVTRGVDSPVRPEDPRRARLPGRRARSEPTPEPGQHGLVGRSRSSCGDLPGRPDRCAHRPGPARADACLGRRNERRPRLPRDHRTSRDGVGARMVDPSHAERRDGAASRYRVGRGRDRTPWSARTTRRTRGRPEHDHSGARTTVETAGWLARCLRRTHPHRELCRRLGMVGADRGRRPLLHGHGRSARGRPRGERRGHDAEPRARPRSAPRRADRGRRAHGRRLGLPGLSVYGTPLRTRRTRARRGRRIVHRSSVLVRREEGPLFGMARGDRYPHGAHRRVDDTNRARLPRCPRASHVPQLPGVVGRVLRAGCRCARNALLDTSGRSRPEGRTPGFVRGERRGRACRPARAAPAGAPCPVAPSAPSSAPASKGTAS